MKSISPLTLFHALVRSVFIQGSFSAKYRQHLGFAFTIDPIGKKLYTDPGEYHEFLSRHTENYNGNPFMAPLVVGAIAHMEERLCNDDGISADDIIRFKKIIGPATGAIGDRLFWSNMRPFSLLAGIAGALLFGAWGAILFICTFNLPVCFLKLRWLKTGYRLGPNVVGELQHGLITQVERILEIAGCMLAGLCAALLFIIIDSPSEPIVIAGGFLGLFVMTVLMLKRGIPLYAAVSWAGLISTLLGFVVATI